MDPYGHNHRHHRREEEPPYPPPGQPPHFPNFGGGPPDPYPPPPPHVPGPPPYTPDYYPQPPPNHHHTTHHGRQEQPPYGNYDQPPPPPHASNYGGGLPDYYPPPPPHAPAPPPYAANYYDQPPPPPQSTAHHVSHEISHQSPHVPPTINHHHTHHTKVIENYLDNKPTVRVYTKAKTDFSLTIRDGKVILAPSDPSDPYQHWIKDEKFSIRVKDEEGFPSFALVNKATGEAMKHSVGATYPVQLTNYNPDKLDESVLWTQSRDLGDGYRTVRMVNNIRLNVDAFNGDQNHGGVRDGTKIVLWEWKKGDNQRWTMDVILIGISMCRSYGVVGDAKFFVMECYCVLVSQDVYE